MSKIQRIWFAIRQRRKKTEILGNPHVPPAAAIWDDEETWNDDEIWSDWVVV
jgi:hypothetical protein